jgi:ABC-type long-subunit fatty acid transport system fused permease/ATPase subunit
MPMFHVFSFVTEMFKEIPKNIKRLFWELEYLNVVLHRFCDYISPILFQTFDKYP